MHDAVTGRRPKQDWRRVVGLDAETVRELVGRGLGDATEAGTPFGRLPSLLCRPDVADALEAWAKRNNEGGRVKWTGVADYLVERFR